LSLRTLGRKVKMEILQQEGDVCELLFSNRRAQHACRLFLDALKAKNGLTRAEFNQFSKDLRDGKVESGFQYSRTRFYAQVRRTLLTLGLIGIQQRPVDVFAVDFVPERRRRMLSGVVDKYVAVRQPITRRPPDGLNLVRLTWIICDKWNREFFRVWGERDVKEEKESPI
jgi:hypothetical protein